MEAEYLLSNAGKTLAKGKSKTRKKCQKIHKEGEDCSYCRNYVQHGRQDLADNHRAAQQLSNRVPSGRQW